MTIKTKKTRTKTVLGLDASTSTTGWALMCCDTESLLSFGNFKTPSGLRGLPRLKYIIAQTRELLDRLQPDIVAIEDVFVGRNARVVILLSEVRGAISVGCLDRDIPLSIITTKEAKKTATGTAKATKEDVRDEMSEKYRVSFACLDESDAVAVALCYLEKEGDRVE